MSDIDDELFALAGGDEDADVEEGEASSVAASSPNSLGSDAMDESDSDRDDDDDVAAKENGSLYPLEGKYIDARDRIRILAMSEVEREEIIGQRMEEITKARFKDELARRAKASESNKTSGDRKRKASSLEPEDAQRKSSRQKVKGKTNDKLEAYKREREQRGQQRQRLDDRRNARRRSSSADGPSDVDAEGESEPEWDEKVKQAAREQDEPAELMHFEAVRIGRGYFAKVCFWPQFEETMIGTYARIGTGLDAQKRTVYKMAQIKGFTKGKPYLFEGKDGQRIGTDQYVIAQHGSVKKEYTFSYLSNQRFTPSDIEAFKQALAESNSRVPTQSTLRRKFEEVHKFDNRFWNDADISERLQKQNKFRHLVESKTSEAISKAPVSKFQLESQRIAEINKNNRRLDSDRVRNALLAERRQAKAELAERTREFRKKEAEAAAKKKAEEEKEAKKNDFDDLFGTDSKTATPRSGTPKPEKKDRPKGVPTFRRPKMEDEIIAALDINLDIKI
ncbi:hypothetical protein B0J11DRAFT_547341 [Dendryphion nanum]|uniref:Plus3 domain-containing protein n=1 Tax=Dendryphion nanum TaxID=256645 RepID=A0A9P9EDB7_9PLEO|nr:hypothetical protein B0J11DRAFT_547341 [Dendryphion nanum]